MMHDLELLPSVQFTMDARCSKCGRLFVESINRLRCDSDTSYEQMVIRFRDRALAESVCAPAESLTRQALVSPPDEHLKTETLSRYVPFDHLNTRASESRTFQTKIVVR